jgi:hypothetical protein
MVSRKAHTGPGGDAALRVRRHAHLLLLFAHRRKICQGRDKLPWPGQDLGMVKDVCQLGHLNGHGMP